MGYPLLSSAILRVMCKENLLSQIGERLVELKGKKVLALGERDGIQGTALAACAESAGAEVVLEVTHCFV